MTYRPVKSQNQLIYGTGFPLVITGWTVAKFVADKLSPHQYAAIGQLFSAANGLTPLVRNILANKGHTTLIALEATKQDANAKSVACLVDFFRNGYREGLTDTGHPSWVVNSPHTGYIDLEIPAAALDWILRHVTVYHVQTIEELQRLCQKLPLIEAPDVEPELYPEAPPPSCPMFPGALHGHTIRGHRVADTWVKILHRIRTIGQLRASGYDATWQELINLTAVVENEPREFYFPEPNYLPVDREFMGNYLAQIVEDSPHREGVKYTYGQRMRSWFKVDQVELVIEKLGREIDAASAVINLWDVQDHVRGGSPCLNHVNFRVSGTTLDMVSTFRSNDMYSAWPANIMGLRALQFHVVDELNRRFGYGLTAGVTITNSQSAHIYGFCFQPIDSLLASVRSPHEFADPSGNFIIEVGEVDRDIRVTWTTQSGAVVKVFRGLKARRLLADILRDAPSLEVPHAGYLGLELVKAEIALKEGKVYRQDS